MILGDRITCCSCALTADFGGAGRRAADVLWSIFGTRGNLPEPSLDKLHDALGSPFSTDDGSDDMGRDNSTTSTKHHYKYSRTGDTA